MNKDIAGLIVIFGFCILTAVYLGIENDRKDKLIQSLKYNCQDNRPIKEYVEEVK